MPETKKKPRKPRAKRAPAKKSKKGLKQKQKQRQEVNVNVSAGGSGGGGYVPIPQAPSIDYGLISQLLRPAATTDVPIRAAAPVPELPAVRPAEPPSLVEEVKAKRKYTKKPKIEIPVAQAEGFMSESEPSTHTAFTSGLEHGFIKGHYHSNKPMSAKAMSPPYDISTSGAFSQKEASAMLSSELEGPFVVSAIKGKKGQKGRFEVGNPELGPRAFQDPRSVHGFASHSIAGDL